MKIRWLGVMKLFAEGDMIITLPLWFFKNNFLGVRLYKYWGFGKEFFFGLKFVFFLY